MATALGHISRSSTWRIAARVRAETPGTRRTGYCHRGRHRSARTVLGRLRGIALSDQHEVILPRLRTCMHWLCTGRSRGSYPPALAQLLGNVGVLPEEDHCAGAEEA
ncbi:hypothetical protein GCM10018773_61070 [Streptomyces candidus]|nr:hypothetical protein GCM10018773_61070 [Streptomyces candidus]